MSIIFKINYRKEDRLYYLNKPEFYQTELFTKALFTNSVFTLLI